MKNASSPHLQAAKGYWAAHLSPKDVAIDATCGNGHDTLFLCQLLLKHPESLVVGLDIQGSALLNTDALLQRSLPSEQWNRALLQRICHAKIHTVPLPLPPRLIVYNLGYLPGGDKSVTTQTASTLESLRQAMAILAPDGAISIMCYPGHEEGAKEEKAILAFLETLPSHKWTICQHRWVNRPAAPSLIWMRAEIV